MDFDWYISPTDKFSYETQFSKTSKDDSQVFLNQLDSTFQLSRLTQDEFLQIWNLIDIKGSQKLNQEQFIYFMHVLNARRKGRALPIGIPLSVKESFLKEESRPTLYTRPIKGSSSNLTFKNVKELERELEELTNDVELLNEEKFNLQKTLKDLETTQMELQQVTEFKKKQVKVFKLELSKFNNENFKNSDSASPQFKNLLNSLLSERQILEKKKMELKRNLESVNREIESV